MDNKVEYIDKSVLTEEQRNEIAKSVNKFLKENKKACIYPLIFISVICLLMTFYAKSVEMLIAFGILIITLYIFTFLANNFEKEYVIMRAKVIKKKIETNRGSGLMIVKLLDENNVYKFGATNKAYSKIKKDKTRYLVVLKKNNRFIISGKIILDITDMIEGEKEND